jgi:hypothetical protein
MSGGAERIVGEYLAQLRSELVAAGAPDADDLVAEIRSLVSEAAGDDPDAASAELERLGSATELARGILAERGLDAGEGVSAGVWWRLGLAAPLDIAIGLSLPVAAALPIYAIAAAGEPRLASISMAVVLGVAALAWPFFLWRPWRRGGRLLTPGMALTGLAVVRAPGFWRLARLRDLAAMGLAPRRRIALSTVITLVAAVLLAGAVVIGFDAGGTWLARSAIEAEYDGRTVGGGNTIDAQLSSTVEQVYIGLMGADAGTATTALSHVTPEVDLDPLWQRVRTRQIRSVKLGAAEQIAPGVYRVEVKEYAAGGETPASVVGTSTFTLGHRQWLRANGTGEDWAVTGVVLGDAVP